MVVLSGTTLSGFVLVLVHLMKSGNFVGTRFLVWVIELSCKRMGRFPLSPPLELNCESMGRFPFKSTSRTQLQKHGSVPFQIDLSQFGSNFWLEIGIVIKKLESELTMNYASNYIFNDSNFVLFFRIEIKLSISIRSK